MPVVPEDERIAGLRRLGVSAPLVRLASGELLHPAFRNACLGPPYYTYHGADTPVGPTLIPLWDHCDTVVAVWERADSLEFIEYSIETAHEYDPLARTEQGFWATRFDFLYECDVPLEALREAASAVGLRFIDRYLLARETAGPLLESFEERQAWLHRLVADIDREAAGPA